MRSFCKSLLMTTIVACTLGGLTACGFQLRGYQSSELTSLQSVQAQQVILNMEDNRTAIAVKYPLKANLKALGVAVEETDIAQKINPAVSSIQVENIDFRKYKLVGTLTEIRLIISADVTYNIANDGMMTSQQHRIQVERSYQYNEASLTEEDQQGQKAREWLYQALAQRITDQYIALTM